MSARALAAAACLWACAAGAQAQSLQTGEMVTDGPVPVHQAAAVGSPRVQELEGGRTVTVLGHPKGTGMAWISRHGIALGYVEATRLLPPGRQRPVLYTAATVPAARAQAGVLPGDQLLRRGKDDVLVELQSAADGRAAVIGRRQEVLDAAELLPVMGVRHGAQTAGQGFAARLGGFGSPAKARRAWEAAVEALPELAAAGPYIFRRATQQGISFELAAAPFDRTRVDEVCLMLSRRERDCWVVEIVPR